MEVICRVRAGPVKVICQVICRVRAGPVEVICRAGGGHLPGRWRSSAGPEITDCHRARGILRHAPVKKLDRAPVAHGRQHVKSRKPF